MNSDYGQTRRSYGGGGLSWPAEFPVDTESITLDADLCLAKFPDGVVPSGLVLGYNPTTKRHGPYAGTSDERQTLTVQGGPTGGTWTATLGGQTTSAIPFNASAAVVQAALEALSTIGSGNVLVTGNAGGPWTLTFRGALADVDVNQLATTGSGLTGGTSPSVAVATVTAGGQPLASDGTQTAVGHLLSTKTVRAGAHCDAALYYKGRVYEDRLPANSGLDAKAKSDLSKLIRYSRVGA